MKVCITSDFHIDINNRIEDTERTLTELVQKVIAIKPDYFIFLGDAYRLWKPLPLEMNIFHHVILDIASKGIQVVVLLGNHDYPDSMQYRGVHCFFELTTLVLNDPEHNYNIDVIDTPSVWQDFCPGIDAIFMPYLPKSALTGTYEETFANVLKQQVAQVSNKKIILFSHVFLREAKVGAGDMEIISSSQVSADILNKAGIDMVFCGDIHKTQKIGKNIYYPGSIERIDFGEASDPKGMICYESDTDSVEFIELNARKLEYVVIDLVNPGFIKEAMVGNKDSIIRDPYSYIRAMLVEKEDQLKDAVVKIKIICTKDQKSKIDLYEAKIVAILLDEIEIHSLKSISYELADGVSVRCADINESLDPLKAFRIWIGLQDYKGDMAQHITLAGENILKGHK